MLNPFKDHPGISDEEALAIRLAVLNSSFWSRMPKIVEDDRVNEPQKER